jgi:hypothetical protein
VSPPIHGCKATVAAAAVFAVLLLLWGRSDATEQLFVAPARVPSTPVLPRAAPPLVMGAESDGEKPKTRKKGGFKAPAWMRQCEYAWDCDSPLQCCEFAGASFCCRGGVGIPSWSPQPQLIPIPVPVPTPGFPPGYPPNNGGYPRGY